MMHPAVSVVMPVRNGRVYIHEAVESVLSQDFHDLELVVVDDGSTDWDYRQLMQLDTRVKVIRLDGAGVSAARNAGMAASSGQYIAFLDADDVWFPGKLAAQIRYFEARADLGVVFGQFVKWYPDASGAFPPAASLSVNCADLTETEQARSGWLYTRLLMGLLVGMNTAVIRRNVYDQIGGFDTTMRIGEDYDFWLRASRVAPMHSLNGPVALYRIHSASAMHRVDKVNHMARLLQCSVVRWGLENPDCTKLEPQQFARRLAMTHFDHGYSHYWRGDLAVARQSFALAIVRGGRRLRSAIYWLLAVGAALYSKRSLTSS